MCPKLPSVSVPFLGTPCGPRQWLPLVTTPLFWILFLLCLFCCAVKVSVSYVPCLMYGQGDWVSFAGGEGKVEAYFTRIVTPYVPTTMYSVNLAVGFSLLSSESRETHSHVHTIFMIYGVPGSWQSSVKHVQVRADV